MADVLLYNSLNDSNNEYQGRLTATDANIADQQTKLTAAQASLVAAQAPLASGGETGNFSLWCLIPENPADGSTWTSGTTCGSLKVCDQSGYYRCGADCTWTVPAGATCARFQLWGAGGGSGPACCCGGSPFGSSAAYTTVSMPVVAGCQYTICSGCAFCCFPSTGTCGRLPGCPSYVTGHGLDNFCADGGQGRLGTMMAMYGHRCRCRFQHIVCNDSGPCFCNRGADYCFASSCASCGKIGCFIPGAMYFGSAHCSSIVKGVRGMWPEVCFDTNHYGYITRPPMYGQYCCNWCFPFTSGTCCGCCCAAKCGCHKYPGMGGWASHAMGGSNGICGDMGRMGMVCVTYK